MTIDLGIVSSFPTITRLEERLREAMVVGIQEAAVVVQEIGREEVVVQEAYDTYAIQESIYVSGYGYSDYEDRADEASDALLNNPTKWEEIRAWRIKAQLDPFLPMDPEQKTRSKYEAYVGVAAAHGKFVESGYVSWWYGNYIEARPFWAQTAERARPIVLLIIHKHLFNAMYGPGGTAYNTSP